MSRKRVPFTILTGFLGAGKTTVLNRLLSRPGGRRIAVLVNELGRISIDSRLIISRGGDVLELAGGCVCCKIDVKNDLWDGIGDVIVRSNPDHVVLETTGIAEPQAIVDDFERLPTAVKGKVEVVGIACIVDADAGTDVLDRREEAVVQIETADRIMLSKLDIAPPHRVEELHSRLAALAPTVERVSFPDSEEGSAALAGWLLERRTQGQRRSRGHVHGHAHGHGQIVAASFVEDAPLLAKPLLDLVEGLRGSLLRVKGFVHIVGDDRKHYLELAGRHISLEPGEEWGSGPRRSELVLIGEIDESEVRRRLYACRAGGIDTTPV